MRFQPTEEQLVLRQLAMKGGSLKVKAFAGAAKTTSLEIIAQAHPARRAIYLAFNRPIADEAKRRMPAKVRAMTNHGLAYATMLPNANRLNTRLTGRYIAEMFGLRGGVLGADHTLTSIQQGSMVLATLSNFCNSADEAINIGHAPTPDAIFQVVPTDVRDDVTGWHQAQMIAMNTALKVWAAQCGDSFPITHDTYLKQWALRHPVINTELILFDEAQDTSPVMLGVLAEQSVPIIWVGDPHQQIYGWRGAVDAMEHIKTDHEGFLSRSFRFGEEIAGRANIVLRQLGETRPLIGAGSGDARDNTEAFLSRTNATAIGIFMKKAMKTRQKIELAGGREMVTLIRDLRALISGKATGAFHLFGDYSELQEYANSPSGRDMKALVEAVDEYGIERLSSQLEDGAAVKPGDADITISTIHKAKGREWDHVTVIGDFLKKEGIPVVTNAEQNRLLYVAVTRARASLDADEILPWLKAMQEFQGGAEDAAACNTHGTKAPPLQQEAEDATPIAETADVKAPTGAQKPSLAQLPDAMMAKLKALSGRTGLTEDELAMKALAHGLDWLHKRVIPPNVPTSAHRRNRLWEER